jgi:glycosyltransferase involved in cell wall biosynthesis
MAPPPTADRRGPRVLLICGRLDPARDGVGDYVVRLAEALRGRGAQLRILHTGPVPPVPAARSVGDAWTPLALVRALRAARGADVVHVQFAPSMYRFRMGVGLLPLLLGGRPLVTTLHEYGWWRWERVLPAACWTVLEALRIADRETGLLAPRSRTVIATNAGHAEAVRRRFARRPPAIDVVPIGANVSVAGEQDRAAAHREVRAALGLAPGAVLLAFFGFVHPVKGVRYLADAVAALRAEGRDVHALVVGGFESLALPRDEADAFESDLRRDIAASGTSAHVHITGFREPEEVSRLLGAADAGVLPFTHGVTAKSGSLLTLLAHGLPTVVTAGEEREPELADGDRVVVVEAVRDGAALAAGLRRVLDDPALGARIAERGEAWAGTRDWAVIADRHLAVYAGVR